MGLLQAVQARVSTLLRVARSGGWYPIVHEPYTGAWQLNDPIVPASALCNPTVFGCVSRIAQDIAKIAPPRLIEDQGGDIWTATTNSAYSPVLNAPNRYQTPQQFYEQWIMSKLIHGNTYVLKDRDDRGVVRALYVLDPLSVVPMVAPDGSVFYELRRNDLAGLPLEESTIVPAREVIHDRWNCLFHPLVGVSPLYAVGNVVSQAQAIQSSSETFFAKGGRPAGMIVAPLKMDPTSMQRFKDVVRSQKTGELLIVDQGVKYEDMGSSAVDSELIAQLGWTEEKICEVYGMPISILNSSKQPPYANAEASQLQYKSQCLEPHLRGIEMTLDAGLELSSHLGLEFDIDRLIWMDTITRGNAAKTAISAGALSPNEARAQYYGVGPVKGGETPYLQQQNWPLAALAERPPPTAAADLTARQPDTGQPTDEAIAAAVGDLAQS